MDYPTSDPTVGLVGGKFTDGNPAGGVAASRDSASWANLVTDELIGLLTEAGIVPSDADNTQVLAAIIAIIGQQFTGSNQTLANPGYQKLPGGLIVQWGTVTTNGTTTKVVTFPVTFPTALLADAVIPPDNNLVGGQGSTASTRTYTTKTTSGAASGAGITFNYIALGH
ncbi:gp53-like domain-containing protein [Dyella lutea]|uniref:Putative tail fiber protein gp53-like C-terminal domain-containing protein n=1 Tax=Dyella lutea TaxID=2950441 RepID=A0ABT1FDE2_9GAMM|nr:hypothetical protein [Dyella lutea]MCP1375402.1 hypothetical protein [Dyella lutea]